MRIKDYKCKCGHDDFFFADKGNQKGIYCTNCGKWLKWADKDEQNLAMRKETCEDARKEWIPVSERLPKCEQKVLVLALSRNNTHVITTGMHEDGSMSECDSIWCWEDVEYEKWDDENDCGIIPEGWYEYHEFNPDGVLNYAIYNKVVAWMPLPEPYKGTEE